MTEEIWKDIKGTNKKYQISSNGRIRSLYNNAQNKRVKPKILKHSYDKRGYRQIPIYKKTLRVHRLVAEHFIPNPENKKTVNHIDGNKENNTVSNLEWCTYQENYNHARKLGLVHNDYHHKMAVISNLGENNHSNKLTKDQVIEIRNRYKVEDILQRELAEEYNVTSSTISAIITKKRWSHV